MYKVFISYKYSDDDVLALSDIENTTVRDYVDKVQSLLKDLGIGINKGEGSDEDLSDFEEETIYKKLKDRIYDSSVTVVMMSPNMKLPNRYDKSQWIPWEIQYSLREETRDGVTSKTNAVLAVVLPDANGSYDYAITQNACCDKGCRTIHTDRFFTILKENMFNRNKPIVNECEKNRELYYGEHSYIPCVKWVDFISLIKSMLDRVVDLRDKHIAEYDIWKSVNKR